MWFDMVIFLEVKKIQSCPMSVGTEPGAFLTSTLCTLAFSTTSLSESYFHGVILESPGMCLMASG
jgi:hypothetical protein